MESSEYKVFPSQAWECYFESFLHPFYSCFKNSKSPATPNNKCHRKLFLGNVVLFLVTETLKNKIQGQNRQVEKVFKK